MRAVTAACLATMLVAGGVRAQPATGSGDGSADGSGSADAAMDRARELYDQAGIELSAEHYDDAARDYAAAYELAKDPVMFFKIASANEKAGRCEVALVYYQRYLREAKPAQKFVDLTTERIAACGTAQTGSADAVAGSSSGSATIGSAAGSDAGADLGSAALGSAASSALTGPKIRRNDVPWLLVGGALAFVTVGAVLAYSASSSESDIRDLYAGVDNVPVTYDQSTETRYHQLIDEGHRYEYLSWASFGLAGAFAIASGWAFYRLHGEHEPAITVAPVATPTSAGAGVTVHF